MLTDEQIAEFESRLRIDRNALDNAVAEQADIYYQVARSFSQATDVSETSKAELDVIDSGVALSLREDAEKKGVKVTEGKIAEMVKVSDAHIDAMNNYQQARDRARSLNDLRDAYHQRSEMLKRMVDLYVGQYFTVTSVRSAETKQSGTAADAGKKAMQLRRRKVGVAE